MHLAYYLVLFITIIIIKIITKTTDYFKNGCIKLDCVKLRLINYDNKTAIYNR